MKNKIDLQDMRNRLSQKLDEAGISMRAASLNAKVGAGYVQAVIRGVQEPTISKLSQVCAANGISFPYIMFGFDMSPETHRLLELMEGDPVARDGILKLLERK